MRPRLLGESWIVHAPGKVNLYLGVIARRPDGFHELETIMAALDLYDTLVVSPRTDHQLTLTVSVRAARLHQPILIRESIPVDRQNLVLRAAYLLRDFVGADQGAAIHLVKRIPAEAGLGGGSSDAAAALLALCQLWNVRLSEGELLQLAAQLGSDVPFFLAKGGLAVCRGRGEVMERLESPWTPHFVLARPGSGLSTPKVFQNCSPQGASPHLSTVIDSIKAGRWQTAARSLRNDLSESALNLHGDLRKLQADFDRTSVVAHLMSGSGTTWFGLCTSTRQARFVAGQLRSRGWPWVMTGSCQPQA